MNKTIKRILATIGIITPIALLNHIIHAEFGSNIVFYVALALAVDSWVYRRINYE